MYLYLYYVIYLYLFFNNLRFNISYTVYHVRCKKWMLGLGQYSALKVIEVVQSKGEWGQTDRQTLHKIFSKEVIRR